MRWISFVLAVTVLLPASSRAEVNAPQLKWSNGGCFETWCMQGWYSSPAVADLNADGVIEIVAASYEVFALLGTDGSTLWRLQPGGDVDGGGSSQRTWPSVVVADVDNDGQLEVVTGHNGGWLSVYDRDGRFEAGWPLQPTTSELRGVKVFDVDVDDTLEIVATSVSGETNTWVYEHDGALRGGWPQLDGGAGIAWGVYNDNAAVADLDGLAGGEILVPSDTYHVAGYDADGVELDASSVFGPGLVWGEIGAWESPTPEERGWGLCDGTRVESFRASFAAGATVISDVDDDGIREAVVTGDMYDCSTGPYESQFIAAYIFNADRTRFATSPWDWSIPAIDTGAPLVQDFTVIENSMPDPVTADLDGDGIREVLFSSYDGRVHAVWLDRTEHGSWPYTVPLPARATYVLASPPVVADLDADGSAEVLFASWPDKASAQAGSLYILDATGQLLHEIALPASLSGSSWNGSLASPTLGSIDADPDLELVINTVSSGVVAYDLPGTAGARVLWATGRWNNQRSGSCVEDAPSAVGNTLRLDQTRADDPMLEWGGTARSVRYEIVRATVPDFADATVVGQSPTPDWIDIGAAADPRPMFYKVRSVNVCGQRSGL